jgi:predicted NAD/FAD-binding protein
MNKLQGIPGPRQYCETLNRPIEATSEHVIERFIMHHPVYSHASFAAQRQHERLNGQKRTYYCGAYWGYGFHEDGVNSALTVGRHFGKGL